MNVKGEMKNGNMEIKIMLETMFPTANIHIIDEDEQISLNMDELPKTKTVKKGRKKKCLTEN